MQGRYQSVLNGTISPKEREMFFRCIHDGLDLFMKFIYTKEGLTTEDIVKFYYYVVDFSVTEAWEAALKNSGCKKNPSRRKC